MPARKFQNLIIKNSSTPIHFVTSKDKGRDCYFFLMCTLEKLNLLKNWCSNNAKLDLTRYGIIVKSGFGKIPPRKKIAEIKKEFGVDFSYLLK